MGMFDMIGTGSILFAIVMTVGAFFVVYRVISSLSRGEKERQRLLQSGVQAQARILNVQMGSMTVTTGVNRQLQLQLAVEVHRPGAAPYQAQFATMVSELQIPQVQPGAWMGVRVDPANPQNMAIEALGIPPPGTPGAPPYGAPPGMPGANPYAAPVGIGAPAAGMGMAPMGGFRLGTGARIGLAVGLLGAVVGLGAAVMAMGWVSGVGGPSAVCKHAAACCRKVGGSASSCDNLTKQSGPVADTVCEESLKGFRKSGHCK